MKRIITVQDISCIGKCSLTVALPIISAMGIETCVLPTALLSTHTAFNNFTFHDLSNEIPKIANHWKEEKIHFDSIYTGYLGSADQIQLICDFISDFGGKDVFTIVDPCMADNGKLYSGFNDDFPAVMKELCKKATVLVPNMTEACLLLNIPYKETGYNQEYIENILSKLSEFGCKNVVLKGIRFSEDKLGIASYDAISKKTNWYFHKRIPQNFHGTGDIFCSVLAGALTKGYSLDKACKLAADFVVTSIEKTLEEKEWHWYGVNFEKAIPSLFSE